MKHLAFLFIAMLTLGSSYAAEETSTTVRNNVYDGSKYIFLENGIEFSVFPDGEFDFYIPELVEGVSLSVNAGPVGISFNTGFDYDAYVQYDEYGAVIQIENTPIYYDDYGRIAQAGDVNIYYRNNRINRVGGLQVYYNNYGVFSHYTGFINRYNRSYVFHPFHNYYYRPIINRCLVYTTPYRRSYAPIRYSYVYHRNNYNRGYNRGRGYVNACRDFRRPNNGRIAHNNGRRGNVNRNNARFVNNRNSRVASNNNRDRRTATNRANTNRRTTAANNSRTTSRGTASNRRATTRTTTGRNNRATTSRTQTTRPVSRTTSNRVSKAIASNSNSRKALSTTKRATTTNKRSSNKASNTRSNSSRKASSKSTTSRNTSSKSRRG